MIATTGTDPGALYRGRRGRTDFVTVPELGYLAVGGHGAPGGEAFTSAISTVYSVAYAAHFLVKAQYGEAPRVMPLEALFWVDGERPWALVGTDSASWRWQVLVMQPDPIDELTVEEAVERSRDKGVEGLEQLKLERWEEGSAAQTLHVGPYDAEGPTIEALHTAIQQAGMQPRGRHHEIYLGDPRRSAPEKLRTLLRHPVEPVD